MSSFLTVKAAASLTGKSTSSIRRVIYPIIHDDQHPDRDQIQPGIDEARELRLKGENFAWRISEELLRREVPAESPAEKKSDHVGQFGREAGHGDLIAMLRSELDIKNRQIAEQSAMLSKQMELISGLSERLGEGNVLIGSLQQRMALAEGSIRAKTDSIEAAVAKPAVHVPKAKGESPIAPRKAEPKTTSGKGTPQPNVAKTVKPKRGLFSRIFG